MGGGEKAETAIALKRGVMWEMVCIDRTEIGDGIYIANAQAAFTIN